jgi:hypothetical protein
MALDKKELEDLNQMIHMFVLFYKTIWNEVNKQFSELPREEKHKIFRVIAPSIVGMLNTVTDDYDTEQSSHKGKNERKRKK